MSPIEAINHCDFCIDAEATPRACFSYLLCYRWLSVGGIVFWGSASCGPILALFLERSEPYLSCPIISSHLHPPCPNDIDQCRYLIDKIMVREIVMKTSSIPYIILLELHEDTNYGIKHATFESAPNQTHDSSVHPNAHDCLQGRDPFMDVTWSQAWCIQPCYPTLSPCTQPPSLAG